MRIYTKPRYWPMLPQWRLLYLRIVSLHLSPAVIAGIAILTTSIAAVGLRAIVETIDNRADFTKYMQNYNAARGPVAVRAPKKDGPYEENFVSRTAVDAKCVVADLPLSFSDARITTTCASITNGSDSAAGLE